VLPRLYIRHCIYVLLPVPCPIYNLAQQMTASSPLCFYLREHPRRYVFVSASLLRGCAQGSISDHVLYTSYPSMVRYATLATKPHRAPAPRNARKSGGARRGRARRAGALSSCQLAASAGICWGPSTPTRGYPARPADAGAPRRATQSRVNARFVVGVARQTAPIHVLGRGHVVDVKCPNTVERFRGIFQPDGRGRLFCCLRCSLCRSCSCRLFRLAPFLNFGGLTNTPFASFVRSPIPKERCFGQLISARRARLQLERWVGRLRGLLLGFCVRCHGDIVSYKTI
jgi:hypothetical protein